MKKENIFTYAELQEMQAQPFDSKIGQAQDIIRETFAHGGKVALVFSGGK